jgi:predicted nucleic acid-binding protein
MRFEIEKHWDKLISISKLDNYKLRKSQNSLYEQIRFINEEQIPKKTWVNCEKLLINIDPDDIAFLALAKFLKGHLWTGDKVL